jgi:hypothetical protein
VLKDLQVQLVLKVLRVHKVPAKVLKELQDQQVIQVLKV